jgi:hypothetical protein
MEPPNIIKVPVISVPKDASPFEHFTIMPNIIVSLLIFRMNYDKAVHWFSGISVVRLILIW